VRSGTYITGRPSAAFVRAPMHRPEPGRLSGRPPDPAYTVTMSDPNAATRATADPILRALRRTRQVRSSRTSP